MRSEQYPTAGGGRSAERDRALLRLAETTAALQRALRGERTWLEWDVLRDSWEFCQANGIPNPAEPYR